MVFWFRPGLDNTALRQEIERQLCVLKRQKWPRLILTSIAYALCAAFIPWQIAAILWAINMLADVLGMHMMRRFIQTGAQRHYVLSLSATVVMEAAFVLAAGATWTMGDDNARAFAVGMVGTTLIHLTTIRAIHLADGMVGVIAVGGILVAVATNYWLPSGNWMAYSLATTAIGGGIAYSVTALVATNELHRSAADAQARALAANESKDRFLAHMSHEIRTPLNAIIGLSAAEGARSTDVVARENLAVVTESAQALSVILDDILDMSTIRMGQLPLREDVASPKSVVLAVTQLFRPMAEARGLAFSTHLDDAVPDWAAFDANRLRQCLSNLLSNAIKHTQTGTIQVRADMIRGKVCIDVTDSGQGIPTSRHEAIFEPFNRTNSDIPGTGLGLSISRALARRMGGDLVVHTSRPGKTTLRLSIAMVPAQAPDLTEPDQRVPLDLRGRRILVVDDIASNRLVAASHLRQLGADVIEASTGPEALGRLDAETVDLVLLDMNMPGMDGRATLQAMRSHQGSRPTVPILAMTAVPEHMAEASAFLQEVDGVVTKPLTTQSLAEELSRVLTQSV